MKPETVNEVPSVGTAEAQPSSAPSSGSEARLWRVTIEYELMVVAKSRRQAEMEAEYHAGRDGSKPSVVLAQEVQTPDQIADDWEESIPFGGDRKDERTCRERVPPNVPDEPQTPREKP